MRVVWQGARRTRLTRVLVWLARLYEVEARRSVEMNEGLRLLTLSNQADHQATRGLLSWEKQRIREEARRVW